jgi:hypothetical protein
LLTVFKNSTTIALFCSGVAISLSYMARPYMARPKRS